MTKNYEEHLDVQFGAENIAFLDITSDFAAALQNSLIAVKNYVTEQGESHFQQSVESSQRHSSNYRNISLPLVNSSLNAINENICLSNSINNLKRLSDWGLPYEIVQKYETKGVKEMFDWQVSCLGNSKVLMDCSNLVYSAPTSAGKTLVAEILTIKTVLERHKKVIIILPFVSIVREKVLYLQDILSSSGVRVEGFMGSQSPPGGLQAVHVAICTIEKANSLVNRLLDDGNISELGAVIVDELHLLGDPHRGYILELLLTKVKYVSSKTDNVNIQIIGMSATLPNLEVLSKWLDAELYVTQFRPIPLEEYCLVGNKLYNKIGEPTKNIDLTITQNDNVLQVCYDTIEEGCSILIFCMTKNWCESLAQTIASAFHKLGCSGNSFGDVLREQLKTSSILETLEQLRNCPVGLDQVLKNTVSFGVAYHHAGLTFDERDIVEGAFKTGAVRVLVATSTLSSGVNLPARRVIIRSPVFQKQPINIMSYKQMVGRAGRMGRDNMGESILVCTEAEKKIACGLMMGTLDPVMSCIDHEDKYMRAILEVIASQVACTKSELDLYTRCTLMFNQQEIVEVDNNLLNKTLTELKNFELIRVQNDEDVKYVATSLGKACLSSSMAPNDGLSLFCELQKARQCLVLETELHLLYLVTPYSVSSQWGNIDWLHLLTLWESLTKSMKKVGELVGVNESFIIHSLRGTNKLRNVEHKMHIYKRFYTALALQDLVNEVPLSQVANKFQCSRGFLQSLQQAASTFAGMVTAFCHQLGWKNMEMLFSQFQDRLHFGIHSELLELMRLPTLNGMRARALFNCGFQTVSSIATADVYVVENALCSAIPFQSEKGREGDDDDDTRKRNKIKNMWVTGYCGLTIREAAENLILEARQHLERDIGVNEIKWKNDVLLNDGKIKTNVLINNNSEENNKERSKLDQDFNHIDKLKNSQNDVEYSVHKNNTKRQQYLLHNIGINEIKLKNDCFLNYGRIKTNVLINKNSEEKSKEHSKLIQDFNYIDKLKNSQKDAEYNVNKKIEKTDNIDVLNNTSLLPAPLCHDLNNVQSKIIDKVFEPSEDVYVNDNTSYHDENVCTVSVQSSNKYLNSVIPQKEQDSIVWDTFDLTENAFNNISDLRVTDDFWISEKKTNKDYLDDNSQSSDFVGRDSYISNSSNTSKSSLPALDANHSSLFEDSFPIDLVPSILIDRDDSMENKLKLPCESENESNESYLNKTTQRSLLFNKEENKLVNSEDSDNSDEINLQKFENSADDVIMSSQEMDDIDQPVCKKSKTDHVIVSKSFISYHMPKLKCEHSKTFTLNINKKAVKCFDLKRTDCIEFLTTIMNENNVSLYFYNEITVPSSRIGRKFLNKNCSSSASRIIDNRTVGIAFFINQGYCVYLDLTEPKQKNGLEISIIKKLFAKPGFEIKVISSKLIALDLKKCFNTELPTSCLDVSLSEWLIDSDEKTHSFEYLAKKYLNLNLSAVCVNKDKEKMFYANFGSVELSCTRAWAIWHIYSEQSKILDQQYQDVHQILDIETQVSKILSDCEFYGVTIDKKLTSQLLTDVQKSQSILQDMAYKLCGYHFNFNSSKEVAKVLGIYNGRKVSTKKSVLSSHNTTMASIIIFWRKLNAILTKTLYPLTAKVTCSTDDRIKPTYIMHTCSGRISMQEPNLQSVPRTFTIPANFLQFENDLKISSDLVEFNCRNIFRASPGYIMVSADYCQLEMRILTHYCKDAILTTIMNSDMDVFKSIAASWGSVPEEEVDDDLRQKAKQLCYGIIYGMGSRTLGQVLDVSEMEAAVFMDTFHNTYPAIKTFTRAVVEGCRRKGYIETLMKRRRYIPDINSKIMAKKNLSERQAVNTTIQGSAADIAKAAMCAIENITKKEYKENKPRLILQLHDELIYEVPENRKNDFVKTIKLAMENTLKLEVPLPVKVKVGSTWGSLEAVQT